MRTGIPLLLSVTASIARVYSHAALNGDTGRAEANAPVFRRAVGITKPVTPSIRTTSNVGLNPPTKASTVSTTISTTKSTVQSSISSTRSTTLNSTASTTTSISSSTTSSTATSSSNASSSSSTSSTLTSLSMSSTSSSSITPISPTISTILTTTLTTSPTTTTSTTGATPTSRYVGSSWHIESNFGTLGLAALTSNEGQFVLVFGPREQFTLTANGNVKVYSDERIWYATPLTSQDEKILVSRDASAPLTCAVSSTGILNCVGNRGTTFYTDGTALYQGATVPAGFIPVTLIAVIDSVPATSS